MDMRYVAVGLAFLLLFLTIANAYTISGNSVIQEDSYSKITVTPHTAANPTSTNLEQTFQLKNKTAFTQSVYIAYRFEKPLISGTVTKYNTPVYSWIENDYRTCALPNKFTYQMNKYPTEQNPNWLHCYKTMDNNTPANPLDDYNINVFDSNFFSYTADTNTIGIKTYTKTSTDWTDVSSFFEETEWNGKTIYYIPIPIVFSAGEEKTWRLNYTPDPTDSSKKWDMVYYSGSSAGCILNDTCTYVQWLDPWWNVSWTYKQLITLNTDGIGLSGNITNNHVIVVDINSANTAFWSHVDSNGNSVRFTNAAETANYDFHYEDWNYATNRMVAWVEVSDTFTSGSDSTMYLYYGNAATTTGDNPAATYDGNYLRVYHVNDKNGLRDYVGGNNATGASATGITYGATGKIGKAQTYDGTSSFQTLGENFDGYTDFTAYIWLNRVSHDATSGEWAWGAQSSAQSWTGGYHDSNANAYMNYMYTGGTGYYLYGAATTTNGVWYQNVTVFDGGSSITLYKNGVLSKAGSAPATTPPTQNWWFGHAPWESAVNPNTSWNGDIDEFRLYSYALSIDETKLLYNSENQTGGFIIFGAEEGSPTPIYNVDWNVFRAGTTTNLSGLTVDWNVNAYDLAAQTSPVSQDVNGGIHYLVSFSRTGYDANNNYFLNMDANKDVTIYLTDSTAPSVGTTIPLGFSIFGAYIKGTGNIVATISDAGSDINATPTSEYTINNGGAWAATTDSNATFLAKNTIAISNGTVYQFNLRGRDNANVLGTGTASSSYTGDTVAPVTTAAGWSAGWHNIDQNITLSCADGGGGCASTMYRINGGAWTNYVGDINFHSDGNYTLDYNSTDNLGNIEAMNTLYVLEDQNVPVYVSDANWNVWKNADFNGRIDMNFDVSGKNLARYSIDGSAYADMNTSNDYNFFVMINTDGNHTVNMWFNDAAGNDTNLTRTALLDKTLPINTFISPTTGESIPLNTITFSVDENNLRDINVYIDSVESTDFNYAADCTLVGKITTCTYTETGMSLNSTHTLGLWSVDIVGWVDSDSISFTYGLLGGGTPVTGGGGSSGSGVTLAGAEEILKLVKPDTLPIVVNYEYGAQSCVDMTFENVGVSAINNLSVYSDPQQGYLMFVDASQDRSIPVGASNVIKLCFVMSPEFVNIDKNVVFNTGLSGFESLVVPFKFVHGTAEVAKLSELTNILKTNINMFGFDLQLWMLLILPLILGAFWVGRFSGTMLGVEAGTWQILLFLMAGIVAFVGFFL